MSEPFSTYPLVQKAYEEQQNIAGMMGGSLPPQLTELYAGAIKALDSSLDGTAADKETAMVTCILSMASPFTFDNTDRFASEYSPAIKKVVDLILSGDGAAMANNATIVQAGTAIGIAAMGQTLGVLATGQLPRGVSLEALQESAKSAAEALPAVLTETAPRLVTLYQETLKQYAETIDSFAAAQTLVPPKKSSGGPKPGL